MCESDFSGVADADTEQACVGSRKSATNRATTEIHDFSARQADKTEGTPMADEEYIKFEEARQTVGDIAFCDFQRYDARLRIVGVFTPIAGHSTEKLVISESEVIIGRDPMSEIVLSDSGVSRQHARVYQIETDFVIEDLGSSNGTYVDGVPIVSCVLHGGDSVQIGHSLFLFDCLHELDADDASNG